MTFYFTNMNSKAELKLHGAGQPCLNHKKRTILALRQDKSVIRTGCLSCRSAGVRCDGNFAGCDQSSMSECWRINDNVAWRWNGTWRERRGMHVFVGLVHSTKLVGLFESAFWHHTVLPACYHMPTLFHLASGIGALFETAILHATGYGTIDSGRHTFALQQCNRSIRTLIKNRMDSSNAEVALVACVLFTCFAGLLGEYETAARHTFQGRGLLDQVIRLEACGGTSGLVRSEHVQPVLDNLEVQAKTLQGRRIRPNPKVEDTSLPDVSVLHSLQHAHWTMYHTYIRLCLFCQDCALDLDTEGTTLLQAKKVATFAPWYKQWGSAFTQFLTVVGNQGGLNDTDHARTKLLQLNFIYGSMLANVDQGGARSIFCVYEKDFATIVQLSSSVLETFRFTVQTRPNKARYPYLNFGLWIDEALIFTMSRCTNPDIRKRAARILLGLRYQQVNSRRKDSDVTSVGAFSEDWTAEEWIEFAGSTRLDSSMARFLGGFSIGVAELPTYTESLT